MASWGINNKKTSKHRTPKETNKYTEEKKETNKINNNRRTVHQQLN